MYFNDEKLIVSMLQVCCVTCSEYIYSCITCLYFTLLLYFLFVVQLNTISTNLLLFTYSLNLFWVIWKIWGLKRDWGFKMKFIWVIRKVKISVGSDLIAHRSRLRWVFIHFQNWFDFKVSQWLGLKLYNTITPLY